MNLKRRAFTLVEVLVVISIVALLVAMLLPVLASSKEASRRVVCASNLHQSTLSLNLYAEDSREWYIQNVWGSLANFNLYRNLNADQMLASYGFANANGQFPALSCPSGAFVTQFWPPPSNWAGPLTLNYYYGGGPGNHPWDFWYGYVYYAETTPETNRPIPRRSMAKSPSSIMLMMDLARYTGDGNIILEYLATDTIPYFSPIPPNHKLGSDPLYAEGENVGYVDGHVTWVSAEKVTRRYACYYNWLSY